MLALKMWNGAGPMGTMQNRFRVGESRNAPFGNRCLAPGKSPASDAKIAGRDHDALADAGIG
jgi:hypothetical protein